MAEELNTLARPYAVAVFKRAQETDKLDLWSEMLQFLAAIVSDERGAEIVTNPALERGEVEQLILEIAGGRITDEGQNLLRLLVQNSRLTVLPQIAALYEEQKNASQGTVDVRIISAFDLKPADEKILAEALRNSLGKEIEISNETDESLIGGVKIYAGDHVIDGSIRSQLERLATELNH
ncbi:MAG: F0F1 ATP synthase subunit delta [gamma proteobacterium symbiont of Bathyaustriella thionipta]|nr:F0F1 ATP synthase subunit delta [gamma proteobacterium symbiont of Bathyaustriella thionipta]